ncbi:MAG: hypothetical protein GX539_14730 [Candidatus Cloacimonetes bacterium]|jgi:protein involved in polysaccharide export with SLBB domain|nr:hypothetical protein [Candidatus Cloacimonadota bacterium]
MQLRTIVLACATVLLSSGVSAQQAVPDPRGANLTRAELEEMLQSFQETASSSAFSGDARQEARNHAEMIRRRLSEGDLQVGDRIELVVEGHPDLTQTFTVGAGRVLPLPAIGEVQLSGVLRSELQDHLTEYIGRYIVNPVVRARALMRLQIIGAVGTQGFYTVPSDVLISDALMLAGGPASSADLAKMSIRRGEQIIWQGNALQSAIQNGRTLDQLSVQAGDGIYVPARGSTLESLRNSMFIITGLSTLALLIERVF